MNLDELEKIARDAVARGVYSFEGHVNAAMADFLYAFSPLTVLRLIECVRRTDEMRAEMKERYVSRTAKIDAYDNAREELGK